MCVISAVNRYIVLLELLLFHLVVENKVLNVLVLVDGAIPTGVVRFCAVGTRRDSLLRHCIAQVAQRPVGEADASVAVDSRALRSSSQLELGIAAPVVGW